MNYGRLAQKLRVPVGFLLAVVFIVFSKPTYKLLVLGSALSSAGILLRIWAAGYLRKGEVLTTSGPYALTRHPLYLGSLIIGIGFTIAANRFFLTVLFVLYFFLFYVPVIRQEEKELRAGFRQPFENYRRQVPFLFPRLNSFFTRTSPLPPCDGRKFDLSLAMKNKEYNSVLGFVFALFIIYLKILYS